VCVQQAHAATGGKRCTDGTDGACVAALGDVGYGEQCGRHGHGAIVVLAEAKSIPLV
jgi:hypothetical protein